eukprot:13698961-Alexandrium_andersonii.AAC.1
MAQHHDFALRPRDGNAPGVPLLARIAMDQPPELLLLLARVRDHLHALPAELLQPFREVLRTPARS